MRRLGFSVMATIFVLALCGLAMADSKGRIDLKVGDEVYVCGCGDACPCQTMSRNPGKCGCGSDLVKAKVVKVEPDKAEVKADSWDKSRTFKTVGKYKCGCGPNCKCDTISQSPGKCGCGAEMIKVE